jgi:gamma-glutamylcyclotransferase
MASMSEFYFAYGSNIDDLLLDGRHARFLGVARLDDHRLAFTRRSVRSGMGVADVIAAPGESVWGALYELRPTDAAVLDRKEGAGWAYVRQPTQVRTVDGSAVDAFIYTVLHKEAREIPPSYTYLSRLVEGARKRGLPDTYIRELERLEGNRDSANVGAADAAS